jgi:uncharacterized damage-inducible protein DinB
MAIPAENPQSVSAIVRTNLLTLNFLFMKMLFKLAAVVLLVSFVAAGTPLSKKERKYAVNSLKDTEKALEKAIAGLSAEQLNFKPSENQWSIDGCVKHIAMSEQMLGGALEKAMQEPADSSKRANIKATDEQLQKFMADRSNKVQTMDPLKPENIPFKTTEEALAAFKLNRDKLINFAQSTKEDLRNHVVELPFGSYDAYQMMLLISSHSARHTQQIEEVKASNDYPK